MSIARRLLFATVVAATATLLAQTGAAHAAAAAPDPKSHHQQSPEHGSHDATAPAQQTQEILLCYKVGEFNDTEIWDCRSVIISIFSDYPGPDECVPYCGVAIDIWDQIDVQPEWEFIDHLGLAMARLAESVHAAEDDLAEALRAEATDEFLAAAEVLDGSELELTQVGWLDPETEEFYSQPDPQPMTSMGQHIVDGLALTQLALGDPSPQPAMEEAMAEFDAAYEDLGAIYGA